MELEVHPKPQKETPPGDLYARRCARLDGRAIGPKNRAYQENAVPSKEVRLTGCCHKIGEPLKQVVAVLRSRRGFRVVLNGKDRFVFH